MKEKVNKILLNEYIINSSDLLEITNSSEFLNMIKDVDINKEIIVKSKLIHKNNISLLESILFGIDNYLSFLKNILNVNQLEIRYIAMLTIFNDNYLFSDKYYYDNKYDIISKDELQYLDINIENHYYYYVIIDINDISTTKLARTYITILKKCPNLYSIGIKHF